MNYYQPNPACDCGRCRTRGLMGPAVLVTLGVLFLLSNLGDYPFERTWPILLIVIGAVKVGRYVISDSSHHNPGQPYPGQPYPGAGYPPAGNTGAPYASGGNAPTANITSTGGAIVTSPPTPIAGALGDGNGESEEAHHG